MLLPVYIKNGGIQMHGKFYFLIFIMLIISNIHASELKSVFERNSIECKALPFDLRQVRPLDGPFKVAMERNRRYLHDLESDRLLHNFRANAGFPSSDEPYGGWEATTCQVRGHFVGHYLSACALMYGRYQTQAKGRCNGARAGAVPGCPWWWLSQRGT